MKEDHLNFLSWCGECLQGSRGENAPFWRVRPHSHVPLDGPNRQSPIASVQQTQSTIAGHSAGPRGTTTTPTNANRTIRIAVQRTQGLQGPNSVFLGGDMTVNERWQ